LEISRVGKAIPLPNVGQRTGSAKPLLRSMAMTYSIRRLAHGDEAVLARLAAEEVDFDLDDRGEPLEPLSADAARAYLSDPNVLHWVAEEVAEETRSIVVGHLLCHQLRMRAGTPVELVLYEIGVRRSERRRGIGRALVGRALEWMKQHEMKAIWVLADNTEAIAFYRACGFSDDTGTAIYMLRED
jgi:ribosomal protein S18 acetylase RimI-like enzyme